MFIDQGFMRKGEPDSSLSSSTMQSHIRVQNNITPADASRTSLRGIKRSRRQSARIIGGWNSLRVFEEESKAPRVLRFPRPGIRFTPMYRSCWKRAWTPTTVNGWREDQRHHKRGRPAPGLRSSWWSRCAACFKDEVRKDGPQPWACRARSVRPTSLPWPACDPHPREVERLRTQPPCGTPI